jgi:hypothetical protein
MGYTRYVASLALFMCVTKVQKRFLAAGQAAIRSFDQKRTYKISFGVLNRILRRNTVSPRIAHWKDQVMRCGRKRQHLRGLFLRLRQSLRLALANWRLNSSMVLVDQMNYDTGSEIEQIQIVTRKFLVLNSIANICTRWEFASKLRALISWRAPVKVDRDG